MKLLDCTLRDGGYYTNWDFKTELVQDLISSLDLAGVDIIELGYKSPVKGGKYRKCNDRFIWEVLEHKLPVNSKLAFMIDAKDFITDSSVNYNLIDDIIHNADNSPFSICRLAIKHDELNYALQIGKYVKDKGYDLVVNLMGISLLNDSELIDFYKFAELNPSALYFADSYGALVPNKVKEITRILSKGYSNIGIHTHDNLGLAFANCLAGIEEGIEYVDGTMLGMGRGVGNVKTEQLTTYFQYTENKYNSSPLQKFINKWMIPLHLRYKWGFTHNYMVSGLKHIHPLYTQTLQSSYLNSQRIEDILLSIEDASSYKPEKILKKMEPKVAVVIPARYKSSRFPGKPLAKIQNKEMIIWVAEIAEKAVGRDNVYIATENEEIVNIVKSYNFKVILTSDTCLTGTDRVAEAALEIDADIIINIQGDEPLLNPEDINRVVKAKLEFPDHVINCMAPVNKYETAESRKIAKLVTTLDNDLMYMSRNPIPGTKTGFADNQLKQVCIYAFTREHLKEYAKDGVKTPVEFQEDIEIIRFLEKGIKVKMIPVDGATVAVDYPEDILIVEEILSK